MSDVDYLYESPDAGYLRIGEDGKSFREKPQLVNLFDTSRGPTGSRMPQESFSAQAMGTGMGGSESSPAVKIRERQPTTEELEAFARDLKEQYHEQIVQPSAMERIGYNPEPGPRTSFETQLSPEEEIEFLNWKRKFANQDTGEDYDLRGAFKSGLKPDSETGHWSDQFKKPNHETFSDESQYADFEPGKAGHWDGDTYIPPGQGTRPPEWLESYMSKQSPPGTTVLDAIGTNRYLSEDEKRRYKLKPWQRQ